MLKFFRESHFGYTLNGFSFLQKMDGRDLKDGKDGKDLKIQGDRLYSAARAAKACSHRHKPVVL
jgi:hypothetical protein